MKDLSIFTEDSTHNSQLNTQKATVFNLFEIELAVMKVREAALSTATRIVVDDVEKCFVGQKLCFVDVRTNYQFYPPITATYTKHTVFTRTVLAVYPLLNQIVLTASVGVALAVDDIIVETNYEQSNNDLYPQIRKALDNSYIYEYVQLFYSALGAVTGKLMFTDCNMPIVATYGKRMFREFPVGPVVYLPFPIEYKGTSFDIHGKSQNIEVTISNVNQRASQIALTHDGLRNRRLTVKSILAEDVEPYIYNLKVPIVSGIYKYYIGMCNTGNGAFEINVDDPYSNCACIPSDKITMDFDGVVDTVSFDSKALVATVVNDLDKSDDQTIPKLGFSRIRCQCPYKGKRCRFISNMKLREECSAGETSYITVFDYYGRTYFNEMKEGETHILQIGEEQILISGYDNPTSLDFINQEVWYKRSLQNKYRIESAWGYPLGYRLLIAPNGRGYNNTVAATHAAETPVDIAFCRKTYHDCRLHFHGPYFVGYPSIPKKAYY